MPLWLRRVLWGVAALLIVLVAAALWLVTTFDANRYKGVAIDWVKTHRNRTLTIDGSRRFHQSDFQQLAGVIPLI